MEIRLIQPDPLLATEYCAMMAEIAAGPPQQGYMMPDLSGSFTDFLAGLRKEAQGIDLPPGRVRQTTWWAMDDEGKLLGEIRLRHQLTPALLVDGGNIGYVVRPSARRKGVATHMLLLALHEASLFGLDRVLLTCDADNEPSRRTIEKNGGVLDPTPVVAQQDWLRYWIDMPR